MKLQYIIVATILIYCLVSTGFLLLRSPIDIELPYDYIVTKKSKTIHAEGDRSFSGLDTYTVLQQVINSTRLGGSIYIKSHIEPYMLNETLTINKPLTIKSDNAILKLNNNVNKDMIKWDYDEGYFMCGGVRDFTGVEGLCFDGNRYNQTSECRGLVVGENMPYMMNFFVEKCVFWRVNGFAVVYRGRVLFFNKNYVMGSKGALDAYGTTWSVISENDLGGTPGNPVVNIGGTGNRITGNSIFTGDVGLRIIFAKDIIVTENIFIDNCKHGLAASRVEVGIFCNNIACNNSRGADGVYSGMWFGDGTIEQPNKHLIVDNNICHGSPQKYGIYLNGQFEDCEFGTNSLIGNLNEGIGKGSNYSD